MKEALYHKMSTEATTTSIALLLSRFSWSDNEVKALIAFWGEVSVQEELDVVLRNKVVYLNISRKWKNTATTETGNSTNKNEIKNPKKDYTG